MYALNLQMLRQLRDDRVGRAAPQEVSHAAAQDSAAAEAAPGGKPVLQIVSPQAVTGVFDAATSAAVQAFQRWSGITADGLVGDQTWAAPAGDTGTSLEESVGLEHAASAVPPVQDHLPGANAGGVLRPG